MHIGVIGAGTASAVSILSIINAIKTKGMKFDVEISCIYDPNIPITHVGESMTPVIMSMLHEVVYFNPCTDMDELDATYRWASRYFWEKANGNNFYVRYQESGLHANSEKFAKFVLDRLVKFYPQFHLIEDNVVSIENSPERAIVKGSKQDYVFDFVIDATGTPKPEELDSDAYGKPEFESVNSVILYPEFKKYDEMYTSATAHDNGWMFGVPLQHRKAFGYLYNNNYTTKEEAFADFARIKDIDPEKCRSFSWRQYYKKKVMEDRVLVIGNRMYFFEPHQAIPLHYYHTTVDFLMFIINELNDIRKINEEVNQWNLTCIEYIQDLIALNYSGMNQIDSPFWKYAKANSRKRLGNSRSFRMFLRDLKAGKFPGYWVHAPSMIEEYLAGFMVDLNTLE